LDVSQLKIQQEHNQNATAVLLTGANGFLGSHLLYELLTETEFDIYCLVRNEKRLLDAIQYYFGNGFYQRHQEKIHCIEGDVSLPGLNISREIKSKIGAVYHAAASTKHYGEFSESFRVNTLGTRHVVDFCAEIGAELHHVSTASVSGLGFVNVDYNEQSKPYFTEIDLEIGQHYEDNIYIHSKLLAEKIVLSAIEKGMDAYIYRVGNLTERFSDGVYQMNNENNAFMIRERAISKLGAISPAFRSFIFEKTPIDLCAKAILALSKHTHQDHVFHVFNPNALNGYDYYRGIFSDLKEVTDEEWFAMLDKEAEKDTSCAVMRAYVKNLLAVSVPIETKCDITLKALEKCGFQWEEKE
jgi:thioester reductase-like protein